MNEKVNQYDALESRSNAKADFTDGENDVVGDAQEQQAQIINESNHEDESYQTDFQRRFYGDSRQNLEKILHLPPDTPLVFSPEQRSFFSQIQNRSAPPDFRLGARLGTVSPFGVTNASGETFPFSPPLQEQIHLEICRRCLAKNAQRPEDIINLLNAQNDKLQSAFLQFARIDYQRRRRQTIAQAKIDLAERFQGLGDKEVYQVIAADYPNDILPFGTTLRQFLLDPRKHIGGREYPSANHTNNLLEAEKRELAMRAQIDQLVGNSAWKEPVWQHILGAAVDEAHKIRENLAADPKTRNNLLPEANSTSLSFEGRVDSEKFKKTQASLAKNSAALVKKQFDESMLPNKDINQKGIITRRLSQEFSSNRYLPTTKDDAELQQERQGQIKSLSDIISHPLFEEAAQKALLQVGIPATKKSALVKRIKKSCAEEQQLIQKLCTDFAKQYDDYCQWGATTFLKYQQRAFFLGTPDEKYIEGAARKHADALIPKWNEKQARKNKAAFKELLGNIGVRFNSESSTDSSIDSKGADVFILQTGIIQLDHSTGQLITRGAPPFDQRYRDAMSPEQWNCWSQIWHKKDLSVEGADDVTCRYINSVVSRDVLEHIDELSPKDHRLQRLLKEHGFVYDALLSRDGRFQGQPSHADLPFLEAVTPHLHGFVRRLSGFNQRSIGMSEIKKRDAQLRHFIQKGGKDTTSQPAHTFFFPLNSYLDQSPSPRHHKHLIMQVRSIDQDQLFGSGPDIAENQAAFASLVSADLALALFDSLDDAGLRIFRNTLNIPDDLHVSSHDVSRGYGYGDTTIQFRQRDRSKATRRHAMKDGLRAYFVREFQKYITGKSNDAVTSYFDKLKAE